MLKNKLNINGYNNIQQKEMFIKNIKKICYIKNSSSDDEFEKINKIEEKRILENLYVIKSINVYDKLWLNDKIITIDNSIYYIRGLIRFYHNQDRYVILKQIKEDYNYLIKFKKHHWLLYSTYQGLLNLQKTYSDDQYMYCEINKILDMLSNIDLSYGTELKL